MADTDSCYILLFFLTFLYDPVVKHLFLPARPGVVIFAIDYSYDMTVESQHIRSMRVILAEVIDRVIILPVIVHKAHLKPKPTQALPPYPVG
jgi:hypothetical protein